MLAHLPGESTGGILLISGVTTGWNRQRLQVAEGAEIPILKNQSADHLLQILPLAWGESQVPNIKEP